MGSTTKSSKEMHDVPIVQEHARLAAAEVGTYAAAQFVDEITTLMITDPVILSAARNVQHSAVFFDSPLEAIFWIWWLAACRCDGFCREDLELHTHVHVTAAGRSYVLDFVVAPAPSLTRRCPDQTWPRVGIELDGHAFHEKTREQVTLRNQRDRDLQQDGWQIFHFSFDEFTKHPSESVSEVVELWRMRWYDASLRLFEEATERKKQQDAATHDEHAVLGKD